MGAQASGRVGFVADDAADDAAGAGAGAGVPVCPAVPVDSAGLSLSRLTGDALREIVDAIVVTDGMIASVSAYRARLVDQARVLSEISAVTVNPDSSRWSAGNVARRELVSELACALRIPERTAERLIATSRTLATELPGTLEALQRGTISYRHAEAIVEHADTLPVEVRTDFEAVLLPYAAQVTVSKLDRRARTLRERIHPESITARHRACLADRAVTVTLDRDGMAWLNAYLPAATAIAIRNRLTAIAASLTRPARGGSPAGDRGAAGGGEAGAGGLDTQGGVADPSGGEIRTRTQQKVDILADLLIDGEIPAADHTGTPADGIGRGIKATVLVTVPVLNLLTRAHADGADAEADGKADGKADRAEPAVLEGYGPIDADTARQLAGHAPSFIRLLTHPETGAILSVGRDRYGTPSDLRRWMRVRDETCRFPGCNRPAAECDIDHTIDWQHGGHTAHDNLAHLCPGHHDLKHHTRWTVTHIGDGALQWTSPTGRQYTTKPANHMTAGHITREYTTPDGTAA